MSGEKDYCTGCEKPGLETLHENKPGKPALDYRLGTHAVFLRHMLEALPGQKVSDSKRPLEQLATQDREDPTIAILDSCAMAADVLSFYQERIANEGYLRTATERRSVLELARSVGYELKPGVAAGTYVVFTVDDTTDKDRVASVPGGMKIQSLPAPGKLPQTFETSGDITARAAWNELRPMRTLPPALKFGDRSVLLKGIATGLKKGDQILFIGDERLKNKGSERWDVRQVSSVTPDKDAGVTRVEWQEGLGKPSTDAGHQRVEPAESEPRCYVFKQKAALFGYNAPDWRAMPENIMKAYGGENDTLVKLKKLSDWPHLDMASIGEINKELKSGLMGEYYGDEGFEVPLAGRIDHNDNDMCVGFPKGQALSARWSGFLVTSEADTYTFSVMPAENVRLWVNGRLAIDESGASREIELKKGENSVVMRYHKTGGLAPIVLMWGKPGAAQKAVPKDALFYYPDLPVYLDAIYPSIVANSWLALSMPAYLELYRVKTAVESSRTRFTMSSKALLLTLSGEHLPFFNDKIRETVVYGESEELEMAEVPIGGDVGGSDVTLDRRVEGLTPGQTLIVSGIDSSDGSRAAEPVVLKSVGEGAGGRTRLFFSQPMSRRYGIESMRIYANVAAATHGETVEEVLGSGDGSAPGQRFTLKKPPLTYVSATTPEGTESTLEVRVGDVLWSELPTLYGSDGKARSYIVRIDNEGKASVIFGDGKSGARLPTGVENVRAIYRSGIGPDGEVDAGSITLLQTRPPGIRGVTNPVRSTGAEAPEKLEMARSNAPKIAVTMGRIVSLRDFEDYSRAFPGIGKAQAVSVWNGSTDVVCITIGSAAGKPVDEKSLLFQNLHDAIDGVRDPVRQVFIRTYDPVYFNVRASITIDTALGTSIKADVKDALAEAFSFDERTFGQGVTSAEVVAVMQGVRGVVAARVDGMEAVRKTDRGWAPADGMVEKTGSGFKIRVKNTKLAGRSIETAQLMLVNPDGIELGEMKKCPVEANK